MIEIKDLLSRFSNLLLSEEGKRDGVRRVIGKAIGVEISPLDIKVKNNIIFLNIKPIYRNEILLKQELIYSELKKLFGEKAPHFR